MIEIEETAFVSKFADVEPSMRGTLIRICAGAMIDSFVKIKPVGGTGNIIIGRNSYINSGTVIYSGNGVIVGENVLIAANCTLAPVNHEFGKRSQKIMEQRFQPSKGGIVIEDDVWIGANTVVLDGAIIHEGCVIGASSLVLGELDAYGIYMGTPVKKIGERK